tara:strand:+ start:43 stop:213 length:171 start_codon:yes stop_codon:yes gene_type:complete
MPNRRSNTKSKISGWLHIRSAETYKKIAEQEGISVTELLEKVIEFYENKQKKDKKK